MRCWPSSERTTNPSPSSERTTNPSSRRKRQDSLSLSLVLFPPKPLCWVSVGALLWEVIRHSRFAFFRHLYYQRMQETGTYLEEVATDMTQPEIKTVEDFLDNIENQQLYQVLIKVDRLTLRIAFMKVQGYSTREIASYLRITEKAVYRRLDRLKEKIQKIFE